MAHRLHVSSRWILSIACLCGVLGAEIGLAADSTAAVPKHWRVPRTADGHPDLQGTWSSATLTRLERADRYGNRRALTAAEATAIEAAAAQQATDSARPSDLNAADPDCVDFAPRCTYNDFWMERGMKVATINGEKRSSIIIDPANGKVPPLHEQRRKQLDAREAARHPFDGPETLSLSDRCLESFGPTAGPPMLPVPYNSRYQIVQNREHVLILTEMIHDARIVRIGGKPLPRSIARWMGDSIGRWEGDTLMVETTHFNEQQSFRGATAAMKVTERFTRTGPDTILYRFTVQDPTAFVQQFTGEFPLHSTRDPIYEYACHEGNYAMPGMLAAARKAEREVAAEGGAGR